MKSMEVKAISIKNKPEHNVILGQSHFIKTVEDVYEVMVNCVPQAKFGLAFCEASGPRLIRKAGTQPDLVKEAVRMANLIGAGHSFVLVMKDMFPVNVLPRLKQVPEIVNIFCATANPVEVLVVETNLGRGIVGVVDGGSPIGVENTRETKERQSFLRKIGYKQ